MKVLALKGSPRTKSFTDKLLDLFIEGMGGGAEGFVFKLAQMKIHPCRGCWTCWTKTPGQCSIKDDMEHIYPHLEDADLLILASPLYVDGFTAYLKMALDRMIARCEPFIIVDEACHSRHRRLADKKQKLLLISTCGFPEADNFDALQQHFRAICRNFWAENAGEILVSAAGMAEAPRFFEEKCALVKEAGKQFASQGKIEQELLSKISLEGIDREEYRKIANAAFRGGFLGNLEAAFRSMRAMLPHRKPPASTGD